MRRLLLAALVLVVAAAAVAAYLVHHTSTSTPPTVPPKVVAQLAPGVVPKAGVYRYAETGYEEAKAGPLKIHRAFPAQGVLVVSGSGHVVQEQWRYSKQHVETTRLRVTATGVYLLWQETKITIVVTEDDRHPTVPVTLSWPRTLHVGQRWTQAYAVGGVHTVSKNLVTGTCGAGCFAVTANSVVTGPHPGTEHDVTWIVPATGVTKRLEVDRSIGGSFPYRMVIDLRLQR